MKDSPPPNGTPPQTQGPDDPGFREMQARVAGTNIDEQTLLATDYLNHFNEIIMMIEMIPDMPELIDEVKDWQPKDYKQHFRDSGIADRELAIEAYDFVPPRYKQPFEENVGHINKLVLRTVQRADRAIAEDQPDLLRATVQAATRMLRRLIEHAAGNIHGSKQSLEQADIDALLR